MTPDEAKTVANGDVMLTASRQQAENAAAYYRALRVAGIAPWYAIRLTLDWQRSIITSAAAASALRDMGNGA